MSADLINNLLLAINENEVRRRALAEIEELSDNCVNAERYGAESALEDLQAIRGVIKRLRAAVGGPPGD